MATTAVLRHRRDTAANWTSNNPVMQAGQLGYETDTRKFKFGDGLSSWISLSYASAVSIGSFASASHVHSTGDITTGIFAPSFLGSGSPSSTNFLRGDGSWALPAGGGGGVALAAGAQTATSGTINFANSNGITFGMSGSTQITASHNGITIQTVQTQASGNIAGAGFSSTTTTGINIVGTNNSLGLSLGVPVYLTTQSVQTQASGNIARTGFTSTSTTGTALVGTLDTSGLSLGIPAYLTTQSVQTQASGNIVGSGFSSTTTTGTAIVGTNNSNGLSLGVPAYLTTQSVQTQASGNIAGSGFTGANASGTLNSNGLSLSVAAPGAANYSIGVSTLGNTAGSTGITGTRIVFAGINNISLSQSTDANGATISINQTGGGGGGAMYANLSGNTSGNTTASGNTLNFSGINVTLSGTNNSQIAISAPATSSLVGAAGISISSAGNTISVLNNYISRFENQPFQAVQTMSLNMASVSHAAIFNIPEPLSISYLRIPVLMTTNSTTIATTAASATGGAAIYSTFNAVVYSMGTGGNSLSLQSVTSGSAGFTFSNSISVATNGTQYSVSQGYSAQALGNGTTFTTQTSGSTSNYAFSTNSFTAFTSARFLDIPLTGSLVGGPYWIVFGGSTRSSATTGVAALSAMTNCNVRYSNHYGVSQTNIAFGVMGSTNLTSGGHFGAGSFSTAGGGTTNSINLSQISSSASHVRLYFQMLRFA
jgi:hypothetical protein